MGGGNRLILMVLVGILIAAAIIAGVNALEQTKGIPTQSPTVTTSVTSTSVITSVTTSISKSSTPMGRLAAQIADPPTLPAGTSHLYVNYSDIEAHTLISQNNSVWFTIAGNGTIDLTTVLNSGLTVGSALVPTGLFDQARFGITGAIVTYYGKNYTAGIPIEQIVVPLANGGVTVAPNGSAGFVVEITPTILPASIGSKPGFEMVPATMGVAIPTSAWNSSFVQTGSRIQNLANESWWIQEQTTLKNNLTVIYRVLASNFFELILNNTSTNPVTISAVNILTTNISGTGDVSNMSSLNSNSSPSNTTIVSFQILANGSIIQPNPRSVIQANQIGLSIRPNQVVVLYFIGEIDTLYNQLPPHQQYAIVVGQEYLVQIVNPYGATFQFQVIGATPSP
jgi:hypothetical protein